MQGTELEVMHARLDVLELVVCRTLAQRDPAEADALDGFLRRLSEHILSDIDAEVREHRHAHAALRICDLLEREIAAAEKAV
ncbi:hypothetical protein ACFPIF_11675 [Brevundimonas faecalis]|uniref:hypothetical protein n=1 Tax=Brevundimonas faecalis TaxID=947378 RepID=UPI00362429E1